VNVWTGSKLTVSNRIDVWADGTNRIFGRDGIVSIEIISQKQTSSDARFLVHYAIERLKKIYKSGIDYKKAW
jgi:hypothetical protein